MGLKPLNMEPPKDSKALQENPEVKRREQEKKAEELRQRVERCAACWPVPHKLTHTLSTLARPSTAACTALSQSACVCVGWLHAAAR